MKNIFLLLFVIFAFQNLPFAQTPNEGLVGYYSFSGNANDASGSSNNGIMCNGATYTTDRFGRENSSALFDGVDDFIILPSGSGTSLNITGDFTVSFWIKTTDNSGNLVCMGDNVSQPPTCAGYLSVINGGYIGNNKLGVSTRGYWYGTTNTVSDNNWRHVVYILKRDTLHTFIDNVLDNELTGISPPLTWNGNRVIGCRHDLIMNANTNFAGSFDDLYIYNIALSSPNVNSLFIQNITGFKPMIYENAINIWPNPTNDLITIGGGSFSKLSGCQIKIINSFGQQVFHSRINQQQFSVDISDLGGAGMYFVKILNEHSSMIFTKKIVLLKTDK